MEGSSLFFSSSRAGCRRGFARGELSLRRRRLRRERRQRREVVTTFARDRKPGSEAHGRQPAVTPRSRAELSSRALLREVGPLPACASLRARPAAGEMLFYLKLHPKLESQMKPKSTAGNFSSTGCWSDLRCLISDRSARWSVSLRIEPCRPYYQYGLAPIASYRSRMSALYVLQRRRAVR